MRKVKSISVLILVSIFMFFSLKPAGVLAAESKVNLFLGSNDVAAWNMAVTLKSANNGGTFDSSDFKDKGYFYVEYTGEKEGMQLILQSWSGGEGWALIDPSEVGVTDDNINYAKFDEDAIKQAYKSDLSTVDAIHVWNVKGSITLKSIDYVVDKDDDNNESDLKVVSPTEDNVKCLGRTYNFNNELWLGASASGAEFTVTGTEAEITLKGDSRANGVNNDNSRVAIYVDDKLVADKMITEKESTVKVLKSEKEETVKVTVIKLSESAMSTVGIKNIKINKDGEVKKTANKNRRIEFIGDSITCAYGVEDENRDHHFKTSTENVMKSYAYKTAQALDADLSITAYSGYGIVSGYTGTLGEKNAIELLPKYYDKVGFSYGSFDSKVKLDSILWDFEKFQPDMIVVNLGTNDTNYCNSDENKAEFVKGYIDFLKVVREKNPNSKILCTLGIMGDSLYDYVEKAVNDYKAETNDLDVSSMKFDVQNYEDGYAADWHPTEKTHTKAASKITSEIKDIMNWN